MADKGVLLVEGKDDEHVFYALLQFHAIPEVFNIKEKQGIENLLGTLDVELLASDLSRLGIVIDADTDIARRWQTTTQNLRNVGYSKIPDAPDPNGTIIFEEGLPKFGAWIMPDNRVPGMLEHFVSFLVPPGDSLWQRADECVDGIPEAERHFSTDHFMKARIHTWLAWQDDPGTPLGLAITKRYLRPDSDHAKHLMDWIRNLFL